MAQARSSAARAGLADENRAAARSIFRRSRRLIRTADLDRADVRVIHVHLVVGNDPAPLQRLREAFRLPHFPHERHADHTRTRLDRDANLQPGVSGNLHVLFPFGVAGKARLSTAGPTLRGGPALGCASHREPLQQLAIQADVEPLRPPDALEVILILPLQADFDQVLAIDRKVVVNRDAAARSQRQVFTLPVVLQHMQRDLEGLELGLGGRQTRRQPRDLPGHRHVSLQVSRRNREDIGEVVEAAVGRLVPGEQRLHIDVEREQVANRIVVFGAIETMDRADPAWIRTEPPRRDRFRSSSDAATAR